jgi:FlaA1/EpsC-like NDP-sugar epimerase
MSSLGKTAALAASAEMDAVEERGERPVKNAAEVRDSTIRRSLALSDVIAVLLAVTAAIAVSDRPAQGSRLLWGLAAIPLMVLLFKVYGLYDRDVKRMSHSTADDLPRLFHAAVVGTLILWLYSKLTPMHRLDLEEVLLFATLAIGLSTIGRFAVRTGVPHMLGPEPAILVGGGPMAKVLVDKLSAHPEYCSKVLGMLAPASPE